MLELRADNVNVDVPSRLKGMASFSKSVSVRRKWIVSRSVLSELVSHLIEYEGHPIKNETFFIVRKSERVFN